MHAYPRTQRPHIVDFLLALGLFVVILLRMQAPAGAAEIAAQQPAEPANVVLGVAPFLVSANAAVHTPDGTLTGPDGVTTYLASLEATYPGADFTTSDVTAIGDLLIIEWQGIVDDTVVVPGRTLISIEDGAITDIWFLNTNNVSPIDTESSLVTAQQTTAAASVYYELPYEQGRPIVVEPDAGSSVIVTEDGSAIVPEAVADTATGPAPASFATDADQDGR